MSEQTYSIIIETISEMLNAGLSKSFIKKEVPIMFEMKIEESFWNDVFAKSGS